NLIPASYILDNLIASGRLPAVVALLVGSPDRTRELAPNAAFADFIANDLVPWARARYDTTNEPEAVVVSGSSRGGLAAAYLAWRHPLVFGNVLAQSGGFYWRPPNDREPEWLARQLAVSPRSKLRFSLSVGILERHSTDPDAPSFLTANRHLRDVLIAKGYPVDYIELPAGHDYVSWRGAWAEGLVRLFADWSDSANAAAEAEQQRPERFSSRSPSEPLRVIEEARSLLPRLGRIAQLDSPAAALSRYLMLQKEEPELYDFGERELNRLGYLLLEQGLPDRAVPLFEFMVERFPDSQNACDSLVHAHAANGDWVRAVKGFQELLRLDPQNLFAEEMVRAYSRHAPELAATSENAAPLCLEIDAGIQER
ncbi:MAG: alpha/beta hydrolase-fold protein, partial [Deltaproteobacteria bacterium]|nr:alpha/beta hydrolase-fold protein [Deltaproteobacteria bacterium]